MILKSRERTGAFNLAEHLTNTAENESVIVLGGRHLMIDNDVHAALHDMHLIASGSPGRCEKHLHHVMMNPGDNLTDAQWAQAWDTYETEFQLQDQPFIEVEHQKDGRTHRHRVYHRLRENAPAIEFSNSWRRNEKLCRVLEHEFGHSLTIGKHNRAVIQALRKEGRDMVADWMEQHKAHEVTRPVANKNSIQHQIEKRTNISRDEVIKMTRAAWDSSDTGRGFNVALQESGLILAKGKRRLAVVDSAGTHHGLQKLVGQTAKEVKNRIADIDRKTLPSVEDAAFTQQEITARLEQQRSDEDTKARQAQIDAADKARQSIREAWEQSDNADSLQSALLDKNLILAKGDRVEFVAVDNNGMVYNFAAATDADIKAVRERLEALAPDKLPTVQDAQAIQHATPKPPEGLHWQDAEKLVQKAWDQSNTGAELKAALEQEGVILARGDKHNFLFVDDGQKIHDLGRRAKQKKADLEKRMADMEPEDLPSVEEAQQMQRDKWRGHIGPAAEKSPPEPSNGLEAGDPPQNTKERPDGPEIDPQPMPDDRAKDARAKRDEKQAAADRMEQRRNDAEKQLAAAKADELKRQLANTPDKSPTLIMQARSAFIKQYRTLSRAIDKVKSRIFGEPKPAPTKTPESPQQSRPEVEIPQKSERTGAADSKSTPKPKKREIIDLGEITPKTDKSAKREIIKIEDIELDKDDLERLKNSREKDKDDRGRDD